MRRRKRCLTGNSLLGKNWMIGTNTMLTNWRKPRRTIGKGDNLLPV